MNRIPIIIPAYEPDERMITLLRELRDVFDGDVIIVNDGSGDSFDHLYEQAAALGCVILRNHSNCGKGRALKNAFNYCLNEYPDMIGCVTADSDGQHTPADILRCIDALREHPDDLVLGCRDFSGKDVPKKSRFGNNLTRRICRLLCGLKISDTQTGLRGIPSAFMDQLLNVPGERFEFETRMLIATKQKYKITEIKIETVYDSKENHQTHFDPIRDSIRIYKIFGEVFIKFLFSSFSSSLIDLVLFHMFTTMLHDRFIQYIAVSTVLARVISATYNYLINSHVVFKSTENPIRSALKYFGLAVIQMCLSAVFVTLGCAALPFLPEVVVKIVIDVILFFISYTIQRELIFKKRK